MSNQDSTKYCIGNGKMIATLSNGNMEHIFGMPYSSPSIFTLNCDKKIKWQISRLPHTNIWENKLSKNGEIITRILDFAVENEAALSRQITTSKTMRFRLKRHCEMKKDFGWILDTTEEYPHAKSVLQFKVNAGNYFFASYPITFDQYYQVVLLGNISIEADGLNEWIITAFPGESELLIIGGPSNKDCEINTAKLAGISSRERFRNTEKFWKDYFNERNLLQFIPSGTPQAEKLADVVESVLALIKAQQSQEGGVLAGYCYKMSYIRDTYGVFRFLLSIQCLEEARQILMFYWNVFKYDQVLHNAQAMGVKGAFHYAENDEVEITGYILLYAQNYYEVAHDTQLITTIFPMLKWAIDMQLKNITDNMLPFNGDETYIASYVLPRSTVEDGSAEATLLFLAGSEFFIEFAMENKLLSANDLKIYIQKTKEVSDAYCDNFIFDNNFFTNNCHRKEFIQPKVYRFGICSTKGQSDKCIHLGWTKKTNGKNYLCTSCRLNKLRADETDQYYQVNSVTLFPAYIEKEIIPNDIIKKMVEKIARDFYENGVIPSMEGMNRTIGYDYGLLLYNLTRYESSYGPAVFEKTLELADQSGAYAEYYDNGNPAGTRCRPWESAVNALGLLKFAEKYYNISVPENGNHLKAVGGCK